LYLADKAAKRAPSTRACRSLKDTSFDSRPATEPCACKCTRTVWPTLTALPKPVSPGVVCRRTPHETAISPVAAVTFALLGVAAQHLYEGLGYDTFKSFDCISQIPANNIAELIEYAKANPGKINYASTGTDGSNHLNALILANRAGLDMVHVPYKGGPAALTDMMVLSAPIHYLGQGKVLGVGTTNALPQLPGVRPIAETAPGCEASLWLGLRRPPACPRTFAHVSMRCGCSR
jgi:hypothetical protein